MPNNRSVLNSHTHDAPPRIQTLFGVAACFLIMFAFVKFVIPEAIKRENHRQVTVHEHNCKTYRDEMNEWSNNKGMGDVCK